MKCLCEDEYGYPCQRDGVECPMCEVEYCEAHMIYHNCFPVHTGDTISSLVETVEKVCK